MAIKESDYEVVVWTRDPACVYQDTGLTVVPAKTKAEANRVFEAVVRTSKTDKTSPWYHKDVSILDRQNDSLADHYA